MLSKSPVFTKHQKYVVKISSIHQTSEVCCQNLQYFNGFNFREVFVRIRVFCSHLNLFLPTRYLYLHWPFLFLPTRYLYLHWPFLFFPARYLYLHLPFLLLPTIYLYIHWPFLLLPTRNLRLYWPFFYMKHGGDIHLFIGVWITKNTCMTAQFQ
jgi:hypothetical protein